MPTNIGSNILSHCSIPLAVMDRYFLFDESSETPLFTVFFCTNGQLIFEIFRNKPIENPLSKAEKHNNGFIVVSDIDGGDYLYKIRPNSETTQIFGKFKKGDDKEITIKDGCIIIGGTILAKNEIEAGQIGIHISSDGFGMGVKFPDELTNAFEKIGYLLTFLA